MKIAMPERKLNPRNEKSKIKQNPITNGSLNIIGACPVRNCILTASTWTKFTIYPRANFLFVV